MNAPAVKTETTMLDLLIHRMRTYDGAYDGYPGMSDCDPQIVAGAMLVTKSDDAVVLLAYLASQIHDDKDAYKRALQFIADHVTNAVTCNMIEGENPFFDEDPVIFEVD